MSNYRYDGSRLFNIKTFNCADTGEFTERHEAIAEFTRNLEKINEYQQRLFAEQKEGIIFVFQAMDAAGKDGAVRAVLSCLSPQGVSETSFKTPSAEEGRHDYLWRFWKALPEKGHISIFNRSYYEDVLVQRVHNYYENYLWADRIEQSQLIDQRYAQIRNFESYLWENSFRVVKIFLNVSKEEQARRFISRIDTPKKNWKFSSSDVKERRYWDDYMEAYEICINRTARKNTPWYVVPADHKWYARLVISRIILEELKAMNPQWPVISEEEAAQFDTFRAQLALECEYASDEKVDKKNKVKPADTAISIALRADKEAVKEKKLEKALNKHVAATFEDEFGTSVATREALGPVYLQYEQMETVAEAESARSLSREYKALCKQLKEELVGYGKEADKVYSHFRREAADRISKHEAETNALYLSYAENIRQFIADYDADINEEELDPAAALDAFKASVGSEYAAHRAAVAATADKTRETLEQLTAYYCSIAQAFKAGAEPEEAETSEETENE